MTGDTLLALAIVAVAAGFLVRRAVRNARARKSGGPGCERCGH